MFESGRKKAGARRGAQRPVDVGFAPTEAKRRYEPVRVRQDSFNIERGYPNGYPLSILRRARDGAQRPVDVGYARTEVKRRPRTYESGNGVE